MKKGIVAYFFSVFLFLGIYLSMLQRIVGEIALSYSLDNTVMGTLIMMTFIGYFLSPILTGEVTDRYGRRTMMLCSLIAMLAGFALVLAIDSPVGAGAGFLLAGAAFGSLEVTMSSVLTDLRPQSAQRIMNNSRLFLALGTVSGPFLAMELVNIAGIWHYVMAFVLALLAIITVVFLLLSYPKPKYPDCRVEELTETPFTFELIKKGAMLLLCVSIMMYVAVEAGLTFYVSNYIGQISADPIFSSLTLSVFWLFVAVGRLLSARYKKDLHILVGGLALIACAGLVVCTLTNELWLSVAAFGIMGFGCSGMFPTLLAIGKLSFPKYAGTVFGILLSSAAIGGIVWPLLMGAVADAYGLKIALTICLVPLVVIFIMQALLRANAQKQAHAASKADKQSFQGES